MTELHYIYYLCTIKLIAPFTFDWLLSRSNSDLLAIGASSYLLCMDRYENYS